MTRAELTSLYVRWARATRAIDLEGGAIVARTARRAKKRGERWFAACERLNRACAETLGLHAEWGADSFPAHWDDRRWSVHYTAAYFALPVQP